MTDPAFRELADEVARSYIHWLPGGLARCDAEIADAEIADAEARGWHSVAKSWRETRRALLRAADFALDGPLDPASG